MAALVAAKVTDLASYLQFGLKMTVNLAAQLCTRVVCDYVCMLSVGDEVMMAAWGRSQVLMAVAGNVATCPC